MMPVVFYFATNEFLCERHLCYSYCRTAATVLSCSGLNYLFDSSAQTSFLFVRQK